MSNYLKFSDYLLDKFGVSSVREAIHTPGVAVFIDKITFDIAFRFAVSYNDGVMSMDTGKVQTKDELEKMIDEGAFDDYLCVIEYRLPVKRE